MNRKRVCPKYNYVNLVNGVHTRNVDVYNKKLKLQIKAKKKV